MKAVRSVYHLMRADFLERVRGTSFLIVMGVTVWAGYMFVPPFSASYNSFVIGDSRGFYNSPWVGTVTGVVATTLLSLIGFYLVKNAVSRDYQTRVGQIIATTPINRPLYVVGKWLSNLAVLVLILGALTMIAPLMQLIRAEDSTLKLGALVAPIWFMGFPVLALVSALAVLFESISFLRGGFGNLVYFFAWLALSMLAVAGMFLSISEVKPGNDYSGLSRTMADIRDQMVAEGLDPEEGATDLFVPTGGQEIVRFAWEGIAWTGDIFFERLAWVGVGLAAALASAVPFDRFDPARQRIGKRKKLKRPRLGLALGRKLLSVVGLSKPAPEDTAASRLTNAAAVLTPLDEQSTSRRFGAVFMAELRLSLKGRHWFWVAGAVGLMIAGYASPIDMVRRYLFPIAWLWPVLLWSVMGIRETKHRMEQIAFSAAYPLRRQLPAVWLTGVLVAYIAGAGFALRLLLDGQWNPLFAWAVGGMFVPSLALALGVWTNGSRTFEVVYLLWWYLGTISQVTALNFMGTTGAAVQAGVPLYYLGFTILLFTFAVLGRQRQIQGQV